MQQRKGGKNDAQSSAATRLWGCELGRCLGETKSRKTVGRRTLLRLGSCRSGTSSKNSGRLWGQFGSKFPAGNLKPSPPSPGFRGRTKADFFRLKLFEVRLRSNQRRSTPQNFWSGDKGACGLWPLAASIQVYTGLFSSLFLRSASCLFVYLESLLPTENQVMPYSVREGDL